MAYEGIGQVQKLEERKQPNKKANKQSHRGVVKYVPESGTGNRTDLEMDWKEEEWTAQDQINYCCNKTIFFLFLLLSVQLS